MSAIISATRTHAVKALIVVLLWISVVTLAEWSATALTVGSLIVFPLAIWFFAAFSGVGTKSRQRLAAMNPSGREWWGILLGLVLGAIGGALLFNWLAENQAESLITAVLSSWGLFFAALGGWLGKWFVGTVGGLSFKLPSIAIVWGLRQWTILFFIVIIGLLLASQFTFISEETGNVETAVPLSHLLIPFAFLAAFTYWALQLVWGAQKRVVTAVRGARSSTRWFTIAATLFGAIIGLTLTVPNNESGQLLGPSSFEAALFTGGAGWFAANRLLRIAHKPSRTILTWAFMVASGVVALVYNLPGELGTLPNALSAGGFFGLLTGIVQLRFSLWTFLRILGLVALGTLLIIAQAGISFAQIFVLAGIILGLMATMMIFNWVANR